MKPWSQGWLIAAGAYPGFCSMKRLEVFLLPQDGMLVHRRSLPRNFVRPVSLTNSRYPFIHLQVERGTVRVKCLAQEHNTLSPARARTRAARSGTNTIHNKHPQVNFFFYLVILRHDIVPTSKIVSRMPTMLYKGTYIVIKKTNCDIHVVSMKFLYFELPHKMV